MLRLALAVGTTAAALAMPVAASASTFVTIFDGKVTATGSGVAMDIEVDSPAANTIRVRNFASGDSLVSGPAPCVLSAPDEVTCSGLSASEYEFQAFGSEFGDSIAVAETATFSAGLYGRGGGDVLLGGGGDDRFTGGLGDDEIDGRGGSDHVDNGYDNSNAPTNDDGSDTYRDTGTSGQDTMNYGAGNGVSGFVPQPVQLSVDATANDGVTGEGDDVRAGFERLRGTYAGDTIIGGPTAEIINGSQGDDDLTGGAGADTIEGNEGVDTVRARDGEADLVIDCDSASASSEGTGETAFVDAVDPEPLRCETVDRDGTTATPAPGSQTPAPGAPSTGGGAPPTPAPAIVEPLRLGPANATEVISRMPRVTGKRFTAARDAVLDVVAFAQVDLEFKRGCARGDFLEVTKQAPITGASISNDVRSPAEVTLTVCIADQDYLRDCDLASVKADVKALGPKALDADVALAVLSKVNRCKVDYDVKVAKIAEEARIKLEAQRASEALNAAARAKENAKKLAQDKIKADLRANITCPVGGSLNLGLIDGYTPSAKALGFKQAAFAGDPEAWTLPSHPQADYQSFIEVVLTDRAAQFPEAKIFLDTDDVTRADTVGTKAVKTTTNGHATFSVRPQKPGFIRVCAVVQTGADEVISTGVEIKVVGQPKTGTVYETQSGRKIKLTADGPVAQRSAIAAGSTPVATRSGLFDDLINALAQLFSGRSRAVSSQASAGGEARVRTAAVAEKARAGVGQITRNGRLLANPPLPTLDPNGRCLSSRPDGTIAGVSCPVLRAPKGAVLIGMSNDGNGVMAFGHDNVIRAVPQNTVKAGAGKLIGLDGSTLIGNDGSTLIGNDGSTLIGNDGSTLIGNDGSTLIGNDGSTLIGNDGSTLIGNDGSTLLGALGANALSVAPAQVIARDGASLMSASAGMVAAGGLN